MSTTVQRTKRIEKAFVSQPSAPSAPINKPRAKSAKKKEEDVLEVCNTLEALSISTTGAKPAAQLQYSQKTPHQSVLDRPDMYLGSVEPIQDYVWTLVPRSALLSSSEETTEDEETKEETKDTSDFKIAKQFITTNDALMRTFIEVLSNAIDNVWRSIEAQIVPKFIKVTITKTSVKVWNDGRNIPTGLNEETKVPIPEMIFGNLFTSSNYNDEEERKTSGRNGLGVKLTNIYSRHFKVTVFNKEEKVLYEQDWSNNMFTRHEPVRKTRGFPTTIQDGKNGFTSVEWTPDFARFGCAEFSEEMMMLMKKYVYDAAMTVSLNKVQVFLNDSLIPISSLTDYVQMYFDEKPSAILSLQTADSYVVVTPATEWTHVAFTNGVFNKHGGVHVDKWSEALLRPICDKLNEKYKSIDIRDLKKHFFIFVCCFVNNPKFDDQPKHKLVKPIPTVDVKPAITQKLLKWDFVAKIEDGMKLKEMLTFNKETSTKRKGRVAKLEDANWAGKANKQCCLCITEGDSAATFAVKGMKYGFTSGNVTYKGRDTIGVYPIRGKFVNVKNASSSTLSKNEELVGICKAMGLQYGVDYSDDDHFNKLRYKKLLILTDADDDGFHITGLLYNLFHTLFPSLLKRKGFMCFMRTPIIKIRSSKNAVTNFYYQEQAHQYLATQTNKSHKIQYLKGLGTSTDEDIKQDFGKRIVEFSLDEQGDQMMENVFGGNESAFRKQWILNHQKRTVFPQIAYGQLEQLTISDFLNFEMINYSIDHCRRAIPSIVDGLKDSTRKIVYGAFKRGLHYTAERMKVAQFANYVAEQTNYHHGETILFDTITKMAQRFVGSNNLPLLLNEGQFGSRKLNGNDAANGRYIFTKFDMCTEYVLRKEDTHFLTPREEEGQTIEPEVYYPIIPLVLLNGVSGGIGSGWSSTIPPYALGDLIKWIKAWLSSEQTPTLIPFYRGFTGGVKVENNKVITTGVMHEEKKRFVITEIPIGRKMMSIQKITNQLEALEDAGKIKSLDNQSTENNAHFSFLPASEGAAPTVDSLGLTDSTSLTNMVLFNVQGKLTKYENVDEIMNEWCEARFTQYNKRKAGQLVEMEAEAKKMYNKIRFIEMVVGDKIKLKDKEEEQLVAEMSQLKFDKVEGSYDYLLTTQLKSMTSKRVAELQQQYAQILLLSKTLNATSIRDIWCKELDELEGMYAKWLKLTK